MQWSLLTSGFLPHYSQCVMPSAACVQWTLLGAVVAIVHYKYPTLVAWLITSPIIAVLLLLVFNFFQVSRIFAGAALPYFYQA